MTLKERFNIFFSRKRYDYSPKLEKFLIELIDSGEVVKKFNDKVSIKYKNLYYNVLVGDKYTASITKISQAVRLSPMFLEKKPSYIDIQTLFSYCRPSRKTEIKFFKWIEWRDV